MDLTPERALIFRITHISNVAWILTHGLHCASSDERDPDYVAIGSPDLISKRARRKVLEYPYGTLANYVPFYFTPCSPMLLNILTGHNGIVQRPKSDIIILVSSLHELGDHGIEYLFTDRHAYLQLAEFFKDLGELDRIDWELLRARDFAKSDADPGKMERYMAEALAYRRVPVECIHAIACYSERQQTELERLVREAGCDIRIIVRKEWFFE